jgi:uncharacterized protein (TIGR03083 family)
MPIPAQGGAEPGAPTATLPIDVEEHIRVVATEGLRFAEAASRGPWDAQVPGCPGWDLRDLVRHLSEIHLWAAANVAQRPGAALDLDDRSDLAESWPDLAVFWPDDDGLIDHYARTNANLVHSLESAPSDLSVPTFLPAPSPLAMWARRQAHETSIHRFDAESATGSVTGFDPVLAADGISELLYGFYRNGPRPNGRAFPIQQDATMHLHAADTGDHWYMAFGPSGMAMAEPTGAPELTVTGAASDLYIALWNRGDDSRISATGDRRLLDTWHECTGVRWDLD